MSLQYDEHRQYLEDTPRVDAFRRAIALAVRPGDVVVDLGCGTGILGLLAAQAGARRVYAIDDSGMIDLARRLAVANGFGDRITHVAAMSTRVDLPEPVDVILSDQMGRLGFEAGVIDYSADAARRWLRPGGRVMPGQLATWVAPLQAASLRAAVEFWATRPAGFDMSAALEGAANTGYPAQVAPQMLLAPGSPILHFQPGAAAPGAVTGTATFRLARAGRLDGIGGWFRARLAGEVDLTNDPTDPHHIARRQAFLPLQTPIDGQPGDTVSVTLRARPVEVVLAWDVVVRRDDRVIARSRQSTLAGMLVPREILARTRSDRRPRLTSWAAARATVLGLCDGVHTLEAIERQTAARHADLFPDPAAAAVFVAEVVTRYGRDDDD